MQNRSYDSNPSISSRIKPVTPTATDPTSRTQSPTQAGNPGLKPGSTQNPQNLTKNLNRPAAKPADKSAPKRDELTRVFNTALVSTQAGVKRDFSTEVCDLTASAPFKAILNAIRQLSTIQGISERQAAEEVIKTFRKIDGVWNDYIYREGLDRLRGPRP